MTIKLEQEKTKRLVQKVKQGDYDSFGELERLARPLISSLSFHYSNLHTKFEYEDFHSICRNALYEACLQYDPMNPSFLSYARTFMVNQCNKELEYWNAEMRNIFVVKEVMVGLEREIDNKDSELIQFITVENEIFKNEIRNNILDIISSKFDDNKADIMKLYIFNDMRPRDIADIKGLKYQNTYSVITRGMKKIACEYKIRYSLDIISSL